MSVVALQLPAFYRVEEKVSFAPTYSLFNALSLPLTPVAAIRGLSFYVYVSKKQIGLDGQSEVGWREKAGLAVIILTKMAICVNLKP